MNASGTINTTAHYAKIFLSAQVELETDLDAPLFWEQTSFICLYSASFFFQNAGTELKHFFAKM